MRAHTPGDVGIYIHVPFCQARCSYCDFNTYAGLAHLMDDYVAALCQEIVGYCSFGSYPDPPPVRGLIATHISQRFETAPVEPEAGRRPVPTGRVSTPVDTRPMPSACQVRPRSLTPDVGNVTARRRWRAASIYLGGGTPSLLSAAHVERILAACHAAFAIANDAEVTIEANPGTVGEDSLRAMRAMGINRLSLGVQSFDDAMLRRLDRLHNAAEAQAAYDAARRAGFTNISLDFMYGLPGQSLAHWRQTLAEALALSPDHLSLYALTLEEHTPMAHRVAAGEIELPDDDAVADMYTLAEDVLAEAGYLHYEISNWAARPELASRHNMIYWRRQPYLGFGAGAHSFDGKRRWSNVLHPQEYINRIRTYETAAAESENITAQMAASETMFLGLRLLEDGVNAAEFTEQHGLSLDVFAPQVDELVQLGLLERTAWGLRLTRRGRLLSNHVFVRFLPGG